MDKTGRPEPEDPGQVRSGQRPLVPKPLRAYSKECVLSKGEFMKLAGTINLQGPEFEKKFVEFKSDDCGDFYLETKKAEQLEVGDFDIWIQMDKEVVKFKTDVEEHDGEIADDVVIIMKSGDDKTEISISLSPKQAMMVRQLLDHYLTAYHAKTALTKEYLVDII